MLCSETREIICIFDTFAPKNIACAVLPSAGTTLRSFIGPLVEHEVCPLLRHLLEDPSARS